MRTAGTAIVVVVIGFALVSPAEAVSGGHLEGYVPAVAHGKGMLRSFWTSDLWIYQQGATVIHLWLNPPGRDNTDGLSFTVALDEPVVFIPDVVKTEIDIVLCAIPAGLAACIAAHNPVNRQHSQSFSPGFSVIRSDQFLRESWHRPVSQ